MSETRSQENMSMEDILASIRRIITEDTSDPVSKPKDEAPKTEAAADDDILELTQVVETVTAAESEPIESALPGPPPVDAGQDFPAPTVAEPNLDIREDQEMTNSSFADTAPPPPETEDTLVSGSTADLAVAALSHLAANKRPPSDETEKSPIGSTDKALEALVKELMRPMLREWLDQHLPELVEKVVQREVKRLVERVEGE